ncbi:MAG: SPOR domain-containing protein [Gammaproteobacteria bacterium]|nr:SPOR domain-containing protein [Gammaproteobacteria bacterium]
MDITELQARLAHMTQLLPSQREWLERLLFQLAFNQHNTVGVIGAAGSGKSALALATAELFSEQYNVAFVDDNVAESDVASQLMQQWFSLVADVQSPLVEQVTTALSSQPLLLVVDDFDRFSAALQQQLQQLPCLLLSFVSDDTSANDLTLVLNRLTSADAAQLLQSHQLDEQAIARRLADANGNMHHLLQPAQTEITSQLPLTSTDGKPYTKPVIAAGVLGMLAVLLWWLMSEPAKTNKPIAAAAAVKPITPAALQPELQPAVTAQPPAEQVTPIATESDLGSSGLDETAEQLMPEQIVEADQPEQLEVDATEVVDPLQHNQPKVSAEQSGEADVGSDSDPLAIAAGEQQYQLDEISLLKTEREAFAVQLAVLSSEAAYQRFKATYPALPVKAYQRNWQGQTQLVLLLVSFADKDTARAQIKQLPAALRATGPFIKSMQAVQTEIKVRQSDTE